VEILGHGRLPQRQEDRDVLRRVGDRVLLLEVLEHVPAIDGQEQGPREVVPDLTLDQVGLVLELRDPIPDLQDLVPALSEECLDQGADLLDALVDLVGMLDQGAERGAPEQLGDRTDSGHRLPFVLSLRAA